MLRRKSLLRHRRKGSSQLMEAGVWVFGLLALAVMDPTAPSVVELCVFKWIGFSGCPGCGLGHAIGFLARGEWTMAIESHYFSPLVVTSLVLRVGAILRPKS